MERKLPYSPWSSNVEEKSNKNDGALHDLVASILRDSGETECSVNTKPTTALENEEIPKPNFCTPSPSKKIPVPTIEKRSNLHRYLTTVGNTGYESVFTNIRTGAEGDRVCNVGDSFFPGTKNAVGKTALPHAPIYESIKEQSNGSFLSGSGDYLSSPSFNGSLDYSENKLDMFEDSRNSNCHPQGVGSSKFSMSSWCDFAPRMFGDIGQPINNGNAVGDMGSLPSQTNQQQTSDIYLHSTPQQVQPVRNDVSNLSPRSGDLQERLIQQKFRELGLGNGTPPLASNQIQNGYGANDVPSLPLRALDPMKQQTTPQKIHNTGCGSSEFPSPIEPPGSRDTCGQNRYDSPAFQSIGNSNLREVHSPWQNGVPELYLGGGDSTSTLNPISTEYNPFVRNTGPIPTPCLWKTRSASHDSSGLGSSQHRETGFENGFGDGNPQREVKTNHPSVTSFNSSLKPDPDMRGSPLPHQAFGLQGYQALMNKPMPQMGPQTQNPMMPAYMPHPFMPHFVYPTVYPSLTPLDRAKLQVVGAEMPNPFMYNPMAPGFPCNPTQLAQQTRGYPPMVTPYLDGKTWPFLPMGANGGMIPFTGAMGALPGNGMYGFPPMVCKPSRTWTQNKLYIALEECNDQYRSLEKERKMTETELGRHFPGRRVTGSNNTPLPRPPANPTKADKLISDQHREHSRVMALIDRMEHLLEGPIHQNVANAMEVQYKYIREVEAKRRDEMNLRQSTNNLPSAVPDEAESDVLTLALSESLEALTKATRKARTALWVAFQITLECKPSPDEPNKSDEAREPAEESSTDLLPAIEGLLQLSLYKKLVLQDMPVF